nr:undecaprenyl diphosphate synthase family protein [Streptomyces clavuligerus]
MQHARTAGATGREPPPPLLPPHPCFRPRFRAARRRPRPGPRWSTPGKPPHVASSSTANRRWAEGHGTTLEAAYARGRHGWRTWCPGARRKEFARRHRLGPVPGQPPARTPRPSAGFSTPRPSDSPYRRVRPLHIPPHPAETRTSFPAAPPGGLRSVADRTATGSPGDAQRRRRPTTDAPTSPEPSRTPASGVTGGTAAAVRESDVERYLSTAGLPDVDLVIRTSGERRLSGFLPCRPPTPNCTSTAALARLLLRRLHRALRAPTGRAAAASAS